ncbi:MAG: hypothetical protein WDW36_002224 [Sanguina aurantia]
MPPAGGPDTKYLQAAVGDALARGCAAVVSSQPNDAVEYLGLWLLRYVRNAEIEGKFYQDQKQELASKKKMLEESIAEAQGITDLALEQKAAVHALSVLQAEPRQLLLAALMLIQKHTSAGAAYAASVSETEEPDFILNADPDNPEPETDDDEEDEQMLGSSAAEEPAADLDPEPVEDLDAHLDPAATGADGAGPQVPPPPPVLRRIDYSKKHLAYIAATPGQEWVEGRDLRRPVPNPDADDPDAPPEAPAFTFRILDERIPLLHLPNVAFEPRIRFFKGFPRIGGYLAVGIQTPGTGEFKAVVGVDTLFPGAPGQAFEQQEVDFVWEVSLAVGKALEGAEKAAKSRVTSSPSASGYLAELQTTINTIRHPPSEGVVEEPVSPAEGGEGAAPLGLVPEEGAAAAAAELATQDVNAGLKADVARLEATLQLAVVTITAASSKAAVEAAVLAALVKTLRKVSKPALKALRGSLAVPQATFHVLKAALCLLGREPASCATWPLCLQHLTPQLFEDLKSYDATQERVPALWAVVRAAYKGVQEAKKLETELPDSFLGVLLLQYIKQVRKVARKSAAERLVASELETLQATLAKTQELLEAAEVAQADAEAAAAAEAEAAALAEEAAAAEGAEAEPAEPEDE